jgi:hypothetical protein
MTRSASATASSTSWVTSTPVKPSRRQMVSISSCISSLVSASSAPSGSSVSGSVEIGVGDSTHELAEGDAIMFQADGPHRYVNRAAVDAVMYLVMTYGEDIG